MKLLKYILPVFAFTLVATVALAQEKADAIKSYNAGLESAKQENYEDAISHFTQAYTIANQIGADGTDIKNRTSRQIPRMHQKVAAIKLNTFKKTKSVEDLDIAKDALIKTIQVAEQYGQQEIKRKLQAAVTQLYYQKSLLLYAKGDMEGADEAIDKAIIANANYAVAYYHKAKIHKKKNDTNGDGIIDKDINVLLRWYDQAISVGEKTNNNRLVRKTSEAAHSELLAVGVKAFQAGNNDLAVQMYTSALNYNGESSDLHFRLAEVYNKLRKSNKAIEHAQKALDIENGGKTDKAKIYFELGMAQQSLNNKFAACEALSKAVYGNFKSLSEHKMKHELKCDTASSKR
ncbi:MAG: hypothetical protein FH748_08275 [Balneolaceae bacterium]|nr:hypothetical protein [Balneolaceae bacterium]